MSKVITFCKEFPKTHCQSGNPTYFAEKLLKSLGIEFVEKEAVSIAAGFTDLRKDSINDFGAMKDIQIQRISELHEKKHTIRKGHRFKEGDLFSPPIS